MGAQHFIRVSTSSFTRYVPRSTQMVQYQLNSAQPSSRILSATLMPQVKDGRLREGGEVEICCTQTYLV